MVAVRYWSVTSRTAATWALARPKTLSVGRPATMSRKWPARRWRSRAWRCILPSVDAPTSAMNSGISGTVDGDDHGGDPVGAQHHDDDGDRDDHGQEQLRQVAGEVVVERVDAAGGQDDEAAPGAPRSMPAGPSRAIRSTSAVRRSDLADADARSAARSVSQPSAALPATTARRSTEREPEVGHRAVVGERTGDDVGQQPCLGDHQQRRHQAGCHRCHQEPPGGPGIAEQSGIQGPERRARAVPTGPPASGRPARGRTPTLACIRSPLARELLATDDLRDRPDPIGPKVPVSARIPSVGEHCHRGGDQWTNGPVAPASPARRWGCTHRIDQEVSREPGTFKNCSPRSSGYTRQGGDQPT